MSQPYPNPTNVSGMKDILVYANDVTLGFYGMGVVLVISVVLFALAKNKGYPTSLCSLFSSSLAFTLSSFLWLIQVVTGRTMVILLALIIACGVWTLFDSNN